MSAIDFLAGIKVLEEVESPINGKLTVVRDLAWGTYIKGGGLTQSGGVAEKIWRTALQKLQTSKTPNIQKVLILGLGGGGIAKIVRKNWPEAKIVGVDVDPIIVELGKKYLGLDKLCVEIIIQDAFVFLTNHQSPITNHYDLVCIDMYVGDKVPEKFETEAFLKLMTDNGICVFNRLYYGEKRKEAEEFHRKLIHIFKKVRPVYPEANVMYVCSN
jgi:spermidine synthase